MCTVSFIARKRGYLLGMNRDEQLSRAKGLPPKLRIINGVRVICPSELGGGTWIALNESGVTLALINWYSITARVQRNQISRGQVVIAASAADRPESVEVALRALPLQRVNPFRLIGIFPMMQEVVEWRWNLQQLDRKKHPWNSQQWISSGFDEPKAQRLRGKIFRMAKKLATFGRATWLRRLHGSHQPECGPFSICMHRADAATVSYTEITVSKVQALMRYCNGALCQHDLSPKSALSWNDSVSRPVTPQLVERLTRQLPNPIAVVSPIPNAPCRNSAAQEL